MHHRRINGLREGILKEEITRGRFIQLWAALGVTAVGASVLSGCGESGEQGRVAQAGTGAASGARAKSFRQ